jgi:hypothetical protein
VPFGAAVFPANFDLTNSDKVILRGTYANSGDETVFAGRPYGCSLRDLSDSASGCQFVGQCSLNPNIFCFYSTIDETTYDLNKASCGSYGSCSPLWASPLITNNYVKDSETILKTLFLKAYSSYKLDSNDKYVLSGATIEDIRFSWQDRTDPAKIPECVRERGDGFCWIRPLISNVKLDGSTVLTVPRAGLYSLSFNSSLDKEQQPLYQIVIDWGDGNRQLITGEDSRPSASQPHNFYHYYRGQSAGPIRIKIVDNWQKYTCFSSDGSSDCVGL